MTTDATTATASTPPQPSRGVKPLLLVLAVACIAALSFFVGRRSTGPGAPAEHPAGAVAVAEAGGGEKGKAGEGGEKGVIKFDREALEAADIEVAPVALRVVAGRLAVTGTVEPNPSGVVRVTPRVGGKVTRLYAGVGDTVRAGQTLATLTSTDLAEAQAAYRAAAARAAAAEQALRRQRQLAGLGAFGRPRVEEARTASVGARSALRTAQDEVVGAGAGVAEARSERQVRQAALAQAQTQANVAATRLARANTLLREQLVSRQEQEQAQADKERADADVEAARASISQADARIATAGANLRVAQARLAEARQRAGITAQALAREESVFRGGFLTAREVVEAEAAVRQARLEQRAAADRVRLLGGPPGGGNVVSVRAPLGGRITERRVTLGETVSPEAALFTVINLRSVFVQLAVYPRDLQAVRVGQPVNITTDTAPGRTFSGTISYGGDVADEATRTVAVRAVIPNAGNLLRPETFVRAVIGTQRGGTRALTVPRDAVQTQNGKTVVYVQADAPGEFTARPVTVGETLGDQAVVRRGLEPGARVVVRGAFMVKAQGMKSELGEE